MPTQLTVQPTHAQDDLANSVGQCASPLTDRIAKSQASGTDYSQPMTDLIQINNQETMQEIQIRAENDKIEKLGGQN